MNHPIPFTKMSGVGNDFIVVDNRQGALDGCELGEFARRVCTPRQSLGGDELIVIAPPTAGGDFSMRTINPDGGEVKMCGNASRCVARYARTHGLAGPHMVIDTLGGPVAAVVEGDDVQVQLQITAPPFFERRLRAAGEELCVSWAEISGAPQAVVFLEDAAGASRESIHRLGAALRYHPQFPLGTNVNFIQVIDAHTLWQRTYERGVEGETLACGTGAAASSVVSGLLGRAASPVRLHVLGGELSVSFKLEDGQVEELFLGGQARFIAEGRLHPEAWQWE